jgi:hypothetical protein
MEEEERNTIERDEEPRHKEPKEELYWNDVLGMMYITSSELQSLVSQKSTEFIILYNFL